MLGRSKQKKEGEFIDAPRRRRDTPPNESVTPGTDRVRNFRRNRTLTGSSSAKVASSNELNAELRSPRAHAHHLAITRRRILMYFICIMVVAGGLYVLITQIVATTTVQIANGSPLTKADMKPYQQSVDAYYAARPIERLRFILNESEFLSNLQATNPEVEAVVMQPGTRLGQFIMTISVRTPIARWNTGIQREYVDSSGIVFAKNYYESPAVTMRDSSGLQTINNQALTSSRFLAFVGRIIGYADGSGLTVKTATIPALTTRQVRITLKGVKPYFTFSVDREPAAQVEDMSRIIRYLRKKNIVARYVDVRVEGKAFYR